MSRSAPSTRAIPTNGSPTPVRRVAVVDDHPAICYALAEVVKQAHDLELCGEANSVGEALELFERELPDIATIDIALPDGHGLDLVKNIRELYPELAIVIYSMYDETIYAERAIRCGAQGYVMKSESSKTVIEALRTVSRGEVFLGPRGASRIIARLACNGDHRWDSPVDALTDREMAVFQMLGLGNDVKEIASKLNLSQKTVETYRRRAKEKLQCETITQLLQVAVQWAQGHPQA